MLISVVLPSNKSSGLIIEALASLHERGREDIEYLINLDGVDQGIKERICSMGLPNLKIYTESGNLSEVLNFLISRASGKYIARADDDDLYAPNRLLIQAQFLTLRPDIDVCGSGMYLVRDKKIIGCKLYPPTNFQIATACLLECNAAPHPVVMAKREFYIKNKYDTRAAAEDYDLWVRTISDGYKFANIEVPLLYYNLPMYSAARTREMRDSVLKSCQHLLRHFFRVDDHHAAELVKMFNQRISNRVVLIRENQEILFNFLRSLRNSNYSVAEFSATISRYDKEISLEIERAAAKILS